MERRQLRAPRGIRDVLPEEIPAWRLLEETARRLVDDGRPMVWVTHDLEQADRLSDQRVVLVAGRLATEDEVRRYLADTEDPPS